MARLLEMLVADTKIIDLRHGAYMLATTKHECGNEWLPIEEYGKGKGKPYGKPDGKTGLTYFGRGYVQLTHPDNYKRIGAALGVDLYRKPVMALQKETAYQIMSYGMRIGAFTGVRLSQFIHGDVCDYFNARKIINILDCAEKIAGYAIKIEMMLRESTIGA